MTRWWVGAAVAAVVLLGVALVVAAPWRPAHVTTRDAFQRGVALGLFASDPDWDYAGLLDEIVATGATDVEIVVPWYQDEMRSLTMEPRNGYSPSDATLRRTLRQARERGLRIMLFPILRIEKRQRNEWRGKIAFTDVTSADSWWRSYTHFIRTMALAARDEGVTRLSVGSEFLALETERARWATLIQEVRGIFSGRILYSANWDHFDAVTFWDLVDEAGMTAYFELTKSNAPSLKELTEAWNRWVPSVESFARRVGRPLVITEVGYPSLDGANIYPWDETRKSTVDLVEQQLCYAAFCSTAGRSPWVSGVYFWNWFGFGGPHDGDYTPRGKPAAEVIRVYFHERALQPQSAENLTR
ncbi:MAG: hypothetical protein AB2A00_09375 [Myxococcota bacterium]